MYLTTGLRWEYWYLPHICLLNMELSIKTEKSLSDTSPPTNTSNISYFLCTWIRSTSLIRVLIIIMHFIRSVCCRHMTLEIDSNSTCSYLAFLPVNSPSKKRLQTLRNTSHMTFWRCYLQYMKSFILQISKKESTNVCFPWCAKYQPLKAVRSEYHFFKEITAIWKTAA